MPRTPRRPNSPVFAVAAGLILVELAAAAPFRLPADSEMRGFRALRRDSASTLYVPTEPDPDSLWLLFESRRGRPWAATFSQLTGFEEDWILSQAAEFVRESTPHPLPDPVPGSKTDSLLPGLRQQWSLRDAKGEAGWMGTGVRGNRYFLVFRTLPPEPVDPGSGPLTLRKDLLSRLENHRNWASSTCPDPAAWAGIRCFRPKDESRFLVRVSPYAKTTVEFFFEEGDALSEVRMAAESLRDEDRAEYCGDLSRLLHGEALRLLASVARKAPEALTWPAWKFLEWKEGLIPSSIYLKTWRKIGQLPDPLPALEATTDGLLVKVELHFSGRSRVEIRENP